MTQPNLRSILDFAVESAEAAGIFTLKYFNAGTPHEMKADRTPVTVADRGAEQLLRQRIEAAYPGHGILGEEFGEKPADPSAVERSNSIASSPSQPASISSADMAGKTPRWILDPVDGTYSFISGVPLYCVLVGFEFGGEMLAGVIHMPALRETVYAARGLGCWWKRPGPTGETVITAARVSDVTDLSEARLVNTGAKNMYKHGRGPAYERLRDACYGDRAWSDAYAYALVATGRVEIALDPVMSIWDTAALLPVVTEAGGTFTDWNGKLTHTAPESVATNGKLFNAVINTLQVPTA